ncbi:MAG: ABC transporter permease [Chthonomonadaceae bacterium]|nr:ABC transporter permease [Chthonomonadaceae bacterium]
MSHSLLWRKLTREMVRAKWQMLAIGAMVALGVAFFNAAYAAYLNLDGSYQRSFEALAFEDFSVRFHAAPRRVAERVAAVPGVDHVEGRLVEDVGLELPGRAGARKLVGRLISIPVDRELRVDRLMLLEGSMLRPSDRRGVLLEASFAQHHRLRPGSEVEAVWGASRVRLRVSGVVQSAEYLYVVRSKHELMAVPDTFGVMFVSEDVLGSLVGKRGLVNEVHGTLEHGTDGATVLRQVKRALAAYGADDPVARADQPSTQMLTQDVQGFQAYAVLFPAFFLSVAAVAVYSLLLRSVHQERGVIGLLRSLGFSRRAVVWHYLAGSMAVGFVGALVGDLAGVWLAKWTSLGYMGFLQVPVKEVVPRWAVLAVGLAIGVATGAVGAFFPARHASRIQPAEAMRPLHPGFGARTVRLDALWPGAPLLWRVPFRNVFRQPRRTLSTLFGIVAGIALMMTAKGILDSSETAIESFVTGSYRYDLRLDFVRPQSGTAVGRVRAWPGVVRAEGVLELPVEMRHGQFAYSAMVSGQSAAAGLHRMRDAQGNAIPLPREGAVFGQTLRRRLDLERGDLVELALPEYAVEGTPRWRTVRVAGFNDEAIGTVAALPRDEVWRMFRDELELPANAVSGIVVRVDPKFADQVRSRLLDLPEAGSVLSIPEIRGMLDSMMGTFRLFVGIMELFGVALALAMIFNMVSVNVLERGPEIATLRTIGVSRRQVALMVGAENLIVALIGIAVGLPFGRWFVGWFWLAAQTQEQQDLFTFTITVLPETYVASGLAILLAVAVSQLPALRALGRLDLAQATKERAT